MIEQKRARVQPPPRAEPKEERPCAASSASISAPPRPRRSLMDENLEVLGRGITNSRSNYDTACEVAKYEAIINTRFTLFQRGACRPAGPRRHARRVPRRSRAQLPAGAVPRAARRSRGDLPAPTPKATASRAARRAVARGASAPSSSGCAPRRRHSSHPMPSASRISSATSRARASWRSARRSAKRRRALLRPVCSTSTTRRSSRWRTGRPPAR